MPADFGEFFNDFPQLREREKNNDDFVGIKQNKRELLLKLH